MIPSQMATKTSSELAVPVPHRLLPAAVIEPDWALLSTSTVIELVPTPWVIVSPKGSVQI